jgi:MoaD family protein
VIKLRLFASLREIAGKKDVEVEGESISIKQALERLAAKLGDAARPVLFDGNGEVWASVLLLVNGDAAGDGVNTVVKSGDVVSVLLPTAGG